MSRQYNAAKLMARLNPKSMPLEFTGARGTGTPELTAVDIAGALGAASAGNASHRLAVDVLCLRWWPARVDGPMRVVGHKPVKRRGPDKDGEPQFYIEQMPVERPSETMAFIAIARLIERRLAHRVRTMPSIDEGLRTRALVPWFLARWSRAVIHEYRHPHHCQSCKSFGRPGEVPRPTEEGGKIVRFDWILCETCKGQGVVSWGKHRRAKALTMREATFRDINDIQEGALALLRELEHRGAVLFVRRLG